MEYWQRRPPNAGDFAQTTVTVNTCCDYITSVPGSLPCLHWRPAACASPLQVSMWHSSCREEERLTADCGHLSTLTQINHSVCVYPCVKMLNILIKQQAQTVLWINDATLWLFLVHRECPHSHVDLFTPLVVSQWSKLSRHTDIHRKGERERERGQAPGLVHSCVLCFTWMHFAACAVKSDGQKEG